MKIDLNTTLNARGVEGNRFNQIEDSSSATKSKDSVRSGLEGPALTISSKQVSILDEIDDMQDFDLRRDDDLGQLMGKAFTFQPPEMPNFI